MKQFIIGFLHSNSKKLGYSYATNKYYANMIRCSARKVTYLIKELNNLNYIRIENPKNLLLKKRFFLKIFSQSSPKIILIIIL